MTTKMDPMVKKIVERSDGYIIIGVDNEKGCEAFAERMDGINAFNGLACYINIIGERINVSNKGVIRMIEDAMYNDVKEFSISKVREEYPRGDE